MTYQYLLMRSGNGTSVHLAEAHRQTALCGRSVTSLETQVPFDLNGCKGCAQRAYDSGSRHVVDFDRSRVDLAAWLAADD